MLGIALVPSLVLLVRMYFMSETPRWLVSRGRDSDARDVLMHSRSEREAEDEIREIKACSDGTASAGSTARQDRLNPGRRARSLP